jgi:hypothetical protein
MTPALHDAALTPEPTPSSSRALPPATDSSALLDGSNGQAWGPGFYDDDFAEGDHEKTRVGVPAYDPRAMAEADAPASPPAVRAAQAVRVVVWRAADGVHVAPQGTRVAAISVDAMLVALDPTADLAAWLTKK